MHTPKERLRYATQAIKNNKFLFWNLSILLAIAAGSGSQSYAQNSDPHSGTYKGVATCASSNCHGAVAPRQGGSVAQNEYVTWSKHDRHSRAWQSLVSAEGKRIGAHLGMTNPEKEEWCLRCHSTFVASPAKSDPEFRTEDGVGCESCHGAAGGYLKEHTAAQSSHQKNISQGLVNLPDLSVRAATCVNCHYGSEAADVTHRLMGAGHPRLSFELDTFTALEPMHWIVDADYRTRKGDYSPAQAWLLGQLTLARATVNRYASEKRSKVHAWPELTLLSCYSCHHSLTTNQWKSRDYEGMPGELRLNTAVFFMVERALAAFSKSEAQSLNAAILRTEQLFRDGQLTPGASELQAAVDRARQFLTSQTIDAAALHALMRSLLQGGVSYPILQYEQAEQVTMGVSAFQAQLGASGAQYQAEMKSIYDALRSPSEFDSVAFVKASNALLGRLKE